MKKFTVTFIVDFNGVQAESESAVRQMWIDGYFDGIGMLDDDAVIGLHAIKEES